MPSHPARRLVLIVARHLDTDERRQDAIAVLPARGEAAQREQLRALVAGVHPTARLRSFGRGAASFIDADHLVVAHYGAAIEAEGLDALEAVEQPALFAD